MDDFEFIHMEEECSLEPPEAKPDTPTTSTQPPPSMYLFETSSKCCGHSFLLFIVPT